MTNQSPTAAFFAGRTALTDRRMDHARAIVADDPAGLGEAVMKANKG
jgi:succinyl-CoA synthetase alpha subunit